MGLHRPAGSILLLLHLTLVAGWVVHAVALQPAPAVTHIESGGSHDGAPPHDERECRLCQTASLPVLPAADITHDLPIERPVADAPGSVRSVPRPPARVSPLPRAPPAVVS